MNKEAKKFSQMWRSHKTRGKAPRVHMDFGGGPLCFCRGKCRLTLEESEVTCLRCQTTIGNSDAPRQPS
jgi:hypothetical protein